MSNHLKTYASLSNEDYAKVFATYSKSTNEYEAMIALAKPVIKHFEGKPLDVISIGAGTGYLEERFIKELGMKIRHFHAIEPNESLRAELKSTISGWGSDFTIDPVPFSTNFNEDKKFDLVVMSHCMYCMADRGEIMRKAQKLLKPSGEVMIFNQTNEGGNALNRFFRQSINIDDANDHTLSWSDLSDVLKKNSIEHEVREKESSILVDDFIRSKKTDTVNDIITFILQTKYEDIESDLQTELYERMKKECYLDADDKYMFRHPSAMILIGSTN